MTQILIADDEQDLVWALQHTLKDEGYDVLTAYDGREALAIASRHQPDLVILDILMPKMNGLQVCRRLRRDPAVASVPILFMTVCNSVGDRIKGLDEGGDDYLSKPFDFEELKARIRAALRRYRPISQKEAADGTGNSYLRIDPFILDLENCQVRAENKNVQLTPTEFELLHYLMLNPGKLLSSRQLLQQVWGYPPNTADLSLVRWHIMNLRNKIEPDPDHPAYIRTVPRYGYKFERRELASKPKLQAVS